MKKASLIIMVAFLVSFAGSAFAAPAPGNGYCPYYGQNYNNLTDDQKAQMAAWQQQMLEQKKQMLSQQVQWGWITQAQADQQITWLEQQVANGTYGHDMMGMGMAGNGMMGMRGGMGCW